MGSHALDSPAAASRKKVRRSARLTHSSNLRSLSAPRTFALLLLVTCADPVHSDAVDALGEERRGVRPGPTHRPGQPCLVCHGGQGPGSPDFSVAGTVYAARGVLEPLAGTTVVIEDANHDVRRATSNEVGNFYIAAQTWSPVFPLTTKLDDPRADVDGEKPMLTPLPRTGDCASCHYGADNEPTHMPPVFLRSKAL